MPDQGCRLTGTEKIDRENTFAATLAVNQTEIKNSKLL
jgi:hypothetical protein